MCQLFPLFRLSHLRLSLLVGVFVLGGNAFHCDASEDDVASRADSEIRRADSRSLLAEESPADPGDSEVLSGDVDLLQNGAVASSPLEIPADPTVEDIERLGKVALDSNTSKGDQEEIVHVFSRVLGGAKFQDRERKKAIEVLAAIASASTTVAKTSIDICRAFQEVIIDTSSCCSAETRLLASDKLVDVVATSAVDLGIFSTVCEDLRAYAGKQALPRFMRLTGASVLSRIAAFGNTPGEVRLSLYLDLRFLMEETFFEEVSIIPFGLARIAVETITTTEVYDAIFDILRNCVRDVTRTETMRVNAAVGLSWFIVTPTFPPETRKASLEELRALMFRRDQRLPAAFQRHLVRLLAAIAIAETTPPDVRSALIIDLQTLACDQNLTDDVLTCVSYGLSCVYRALGASSEKCMAIYEALAYINLESPYRYTLPRTDEKNLVFHAATPEETGTAIYERLCAFFDDKTLLEKVRIGAGGGLTEIAKDEKTKPAIQSAIIGKLQNAVREGKFLEDATRQVIGQLFHIAAGEAISADDREAIFGDLQAMVRNPAFSDGIRKEAAIPAFVDCARDWKLLPHLQKMIREPILPKGTRGNIVRALAQFSASTTTSAENRIAILENFSGLACNRSLSENVRKGALNGIRSAVLFETLLGKDYLSTFCADCQVLLQEPDVPEKVWRNAVRVLSAIARRTKEVSPEERSALIANLHSVKEQALSEKRSQFLTWVLALITTDYDICKDVWKGQMPPSSFIAYVQEAFRDPELVYKGWKRDFVWFLAGVALQATTSSDIRSLVRSDLERAGQDPSLSEETHEKIAWALGLLVAKKSDESPTIIANLETLLVDEGRPAMMRRYAARGLEFGAIFALNPAPLNWIKAYLLSTPAWSLNENALTHSVASLVRSYVLIHQRPLQDKEASLQGEKKTAQPQSLAALIAPYPLAEEKAISPQEALTKAFHQAFQSIIEHLSTSLANPLLATNVRLPLLQSLKILVKERTFPEGSIRQPATEGLCHAVKVLGDVIRNEHTPDDSRLFTLQMLQDTLKDTALPTPLRQEAIQQLCESVRFVKASSGAKTVTLYALNIGLTGELVPSENRSQILKALKEVMDDDSFSLSDCQSIVATFGSLVGTETTPVELQDSLLRDLQEMTQNPAAAPIIRLAALEQLGQLLAGATTLPDTKIRLFSLLQETARKGPEGIRERTFQILSNSLETLVGLTEPFVPTLTRLFSYETLHSMTQDTSLPEGLYHRVIQALLERVGVLGEIGAREHRYRSLTLLQTLAHPSSGKSDDLRSRATQVLDQTVTALKAATRSRFCKQETQKELRQLLQGIAADELLEECVRQKAAAA